MGASKAKQDLQRARSAYVNAQLSLAEIANMFGKSVSTVNRWKREATRIGDCWDRARAAHHLQVQDRVVFALISDFVTLHQKTVEDLKTADIPIEKKVKLLATLATAFSKTMNAAGKAAPELSRLAVAQDVIRRMASFVQAQYPEHASILLEILEPFGQELATNYG